MDILHSLIKKYTWFSGGCVLVIFALSGNANSTQFVTPVCYIQNGCVALSPSSPSAIDRVQASITLFSGIPADACIGRLNAFVSDYTISISGNYSHCADVVLPGPPPTIVSALLEPLAVGHYTIRFTASPDTNTETGWVNGPNGWTQASILVTAPLDVAAADTTPNYEGLWWAAPAGSESGWGINFAHQGDILFTTWFTYDKFGKPWWLSMPANETDRGSFAGILYETVGPPFDATPFNPLDVTASPVGSGTVIFSDANNATFTYTIGTVTQTKSITKEVFRTVPNCTFGIEEDLSLASNYQDLWWADPPGSESGWGINLTEQSDVIFATWFTYDHTGKPMWLSATTYDIGSSTYAGDLYRTTGPSFDVPRFDSSAVVATQVGTATFTFTDGSHGSFHYVVNGEEGTKHITRQVFRAPGTVCQ